MHNVTFQPPFIAPYIAPYEAIEKKESNDRDIQLRSSQIIEHLGDLTPISEFENNRSWKPLYNNNFWNLGTYIANNWRQIAKDACGGYFCCFKSCKAKVEDAKKYKVPITQEFHRVTRQATKDFHTNLFGLGIIAPSLTLAAGLTNSVALTIIAGLATLYYAGVRTYVFSGDFGVQNFNGSLILGSGIRLAATDSFKEGHHALVKHLESTWNTTDENERNTLTERCLKIAKEANWNNLLQWLNTAGIHDETVKAIVTPLSNFIFQINAERLRIPRQLISDEPSSPKASHVTIHVCEDT